MSAHPLRIPVIMAAPTQKEVIFVAAPLGITELDKDIVSQEWDLIKASICH